MKHYKMTVPQSKNFSKNLTYTVIQREMRLTDLSQKTDTDHQTLRRHLANLERATTDVQVPKDFIDRIIGVLGTSLAELMKSKTPDIKTNNKGLGIQVGEYLKTLRARRQWTQQYLADKIGTTPQRISQTERGLDFDYFEKMAKLLAHSPEALEYILQHRHKPFIIPFESRSVYSRSVRDTRESAHI